MANVDIRDRLPPVWNQRGLEACMAIVACDLIACGMRRCQTPLAGSEPFIPSPMFVYYNARKLAGHENHNVPVQPSLVIRAIRESGVCPEEAWAFHTFRYAQRPPENAYRLAEQTPRFEFRALPQSFAAFRRLLDDGVPFLFCLRLFRSNSRDFENGKSLTNDTLTMPGFGESPVRSHAVVATGYDDERAVFLIRNSLGPKWGGEGYFALPFEYLLSPACSYAFYALADNCSG